MGGENKVCLLAEEAGNYEGNFKNVVSTRCRSDSCTVFPVIDRGGAGYKVGGVPLCGSCLSNEYLELAKDV